MNTVTASTGAAPSSTVPTPSASQNKAETQPSPADPVPCHHAGNVTLRSRGKRASARTQPHTFLVHLAQDLCVSGRVVGEYGAHSIRIAHQHSTRTTMLMTPASKHAYTMQAIVRLRLTWQKTAQRSPKTLSCVRTCNTLRGPHDSRRHFIFRHSKQLRRHARNKRGH